MGSKSHKGKNAKENWLVSIYYNNATVFAIVVPAAELGSGLTFVLGKVPVLWEYKAFLAFVAVLNAILAFKMFVNVH